MDITVLIFIVIGIVVIGGFAFAFYSAKKRKDASWNGIVIDKAMEENVNRSSDYDSFGERNRSGISIGGVNVGGLGGGQNIAVTHSYKITVRPETGDVFQWGVSSGMYEQLSIGDKVVKRPGSTTPEIVEKVATAPQAPTPPPSSTQPPTPPILPQQ